MSIFQCFLLFVIFAFVWLLSQIAWKMIEIRLTIRKQQQMMDSLYAGVVRMFIQGAAEAKAIKRRGEK